MREVRIPARSVGEKLQGLRSIRDQAQLARPLMIAADDGLLTWGDESRLIIWTAGGPSEAKAVIRTACVDNGQVVVEDTVRTAREAIESLEAMLKEYPETWNHMLEVAPPLPKKPGKCLAVWVS